MLTASPRRVRPAPAPRPRPGRRSRPATRVPEAGLVAFGRVWTGNPDQPWAGGVAMRGDTILAVGDSGDIARYVGEQTEVVTAAGAMIVPGFMDGHTHFLDGGIQLVSVDLRTADTPEEFTARIAAFAAERKPGEWIIGGDWDHERWPGTPLPTKAWIDSVTPNNPVFVNRLDGHMGVANSAALRAAGITKATKDIPGGEIVRDPRTGRADRRPQGQRPDSGVRGVAPAVGGAVGRGAGPGRGVRRLARASRPSTT